MDLAKESFLDLIAPLIIDDKLIALNAIVMKDLVTHFESIGDLKTIEECILHLGPEKLQFIFSSDISDGMQVGLCSCVYLQLDTRNRFGAVC